MCLRIPTKQSLTPTHGRGCRNYGKTNDARRGQERQICFPALCAVPIAAKSCITAQARTLKQDKTILFALLQGSRGKRFVKELAAKRRQLTQAERRIEELDRLFKRIYEDNVGGKLSDSRFQMLSDDYEQEQEELRKKLLRLNEEISEQEEQTEDIDRFISKVRKYLDLDELTPSVLNDMVKAVYVHAPDKSKGHREQQIDISYDLVGILPASLLNDLQNGETA